MSEEESSGKERFECLEDLPGVGPTMSKRLRELGFRFVEPETGFLACGYAGKGRLASTEAILREVKDALETKPSPER